MVTCHRGRIRCSLLGRERSTLTRPAEAERTGALPAHRVALRVCDGHDGVIERCLDVHDPKRNVLLFLALEGLARALSFFPRVGGCCCWFRHGPLLSAAKPAAPLSIVIKLYVLAVAF